MVPVGLCVCVCVCVCVPAVGLRHMMRGVPDVWLSTLSDGLKTEEAVDG